MWTICCCVESVIFTSDWSVLFRHVFPTQVFEICASECDYGMHRQHCHICFMNNLFDECDYLYISDFCTWDVPDSYFRFFTKNSHFFGVKSDVLQKIILMQSRSFEHATMTHIINNDVETHLRQFKVNSHNCIAHWKCFKIFAIYPKMITLESKVKVFKNVLWCSLGLLSTKKFHKSMSSIWKVI